MSEHIASYSCIPSTALGGGKGDDAAATPAKLQKTTLGSFFKKSYTKSAATSDLTEQQAIEAELNSYITCVFLPPAHPQSVLLAQVVILCPATGQL